MTSNTTPSGTVSGRLAWNADGDRTSDAYRAFDRNLSTSAVSRYYATNPWFAYTFENPIVVKSYYIKSIASYTQTLQIIGIDNSGIETILDNLVLGGSEEKTEKLNNTVAYKTYKVKLVDSTAPNTPTNTFMGIAELQFYNK